MHSKSRGWPSDTAALSTPEAYRKKHEELAEYCRKDAEFTTRVPVYPAAYPKPLAAWKVLWRLLKASVLLKLRIRKSVAMPFLKCDKKGCVHVEFHDELTQAHVGKPCPQCGESLLTQADFDKWRSGE